MAGAVEAGLRVAVEVMDEIRPQSLTAQDYVLIKDWKKFGQKRGQVETRRACRSKGLNVGGHILTI
jgi:hypothetical protein